MDSVNLALLAKKEWESRVCSGRILRGLWNPVTEATKRGYSCRVTCSALTQLFYNFERWYGLTQDNHTLRHAKRKDLLLDEQQCRSFIEQTWFQLRKRFNCPNTPPPYVTCSIHSQTYVEEFNVLEGTAHYKPGVHEIFLPWWAQNKLIILHEMAHAFQRCMRYSDGTFGIDSSEDGHGGTFTAIFLWMLVYFGHIDWTMKECEQRCADSYIHFNKTIWS